MEHTAEHGEHRGGGTKEIMKVTGILTVLTIIELALGFWMMSFPLEQHSIRLAIKGTIIILTIVVPLTLFAWFITAFLYDGNSFRNLRNTYDPHFKEQSTIKIEKKEGEHKAESKEAKPATETEAVEHGKH